MSHPLLPTHRIPRLRVCTHHQKLPNHRRMPVPRSHVQRSLPILRRAAALNQAHPLFVRVRAPAPKTLCITKPRKGQTRDGARQLTSRQTTMPRKAGFGLADFLRDGKTFEGLVSIPSSKTDREEGACTSCASSYTRDPLHQTCIEAQKENETDQTPFPQNHDCTKGCIPDAVAVSRSPKNE